MTIKMYRVKDMDGYIFGWAPNYVLDEPAISTEWYDEIACTLPDGYYVAKNMYDQSTIFNAAGKGCPISDMDGHPGLIDIDNDIVYVRLQEVA